MFVVELITLPVAFATFEFVELAFAAFAATALIRALVLAFDPFVLELFSEQPANPKTVKLNKIIAEKVFIFTPVGLW